MKLSDKTGILAWIALCVTVGAAGSVATTSAVRDWYPYIAKPAWTPPDWLFAPVWTALYILMAVAAWLVWKDREFPGHKTALTLFIVQLALNAAWSWIFFGAHQLGFAFAEILLMWAAIAATIWAFSRQSKLAAWLLVPYIAWVTFAAALSFAIWRLN